MDQTLSNFGNVFAFLALGVVFVAGGLKALEQSPLGVLTLRSGQERSGDGLLRAGQAEITPFRSEDGVLQHGHSFGLGPAKSSTYTTKSVDARAKDC